MMEKRRDGLSELREVDAGLQASPRVKARVMDAYRAAHGRRRPRAVWRWASAAAACLLFAAGVVWFAGDARRVKAPAAPVIAEVADPPVTNDVAAGSPARSTQAVAVSRRPHAARRVVRAASARSPGPDREIATDFLALPFAPPLDEAEGAQVVRVSLPRSAMRTVGLPVSEDRWYERVSADVLLGHDGVARAVRFVKFSQQ